MVRFDEEIYFIADLHLYDKNIITYCNRPFADLIDMHEALVENWNKTMSDDSHVYLLGDLSVGTFSETKNIVEQLKGHKHIILGNHDEFTHEEYIDMGFETISDYPILLFDCVILSHHPQFVNVNSPYVNIFGHVHNNPMYNTFSSNSACVSVERENKYRPVRWSYIKWRISDERSGLHK